MKIFFRRAVQSLENSEISFWPWLAAFTSLVVIRVFLESSQMINFAGGSLFFDAVHSFLFFLLTYSIFTIFLRYFLKIEIKKAANVTLFGFLIILVPPVVDYFFCGPGCLRTYEFEGVSGLIPLTFNFFGKDVTTGITIGVKTEIILALVLIFLYAFSRTVKFLKAITATIISYLLFFFLATLPTYLTMLIYGFSKGLINISRDDVIRLFQSTENIFFLNISDAQTAVNIRMSFILSFLLLAVIFVYLILNARPKLFSYLRNARYPQLFIHWGLVVVGAGLALVYAGAGIKINFFNALGFILLEIAVACAWLASVVPNDIYDKNSDALTPNKNRPLVTNTFTLQEYASVGWVLFLVSLIFSAIINFKIALFLLAYQAIAWIYSCWPLRLKRFAFISSFLSALALLMILFSGFILIAPEQNIKHLPFSIIALLTIGYTLSLPIKDFKDIEGDKREGVYTVPVLFGEQWGKLIGGGGIFISFLLSVALLNEFRLFWWALLAGSISLWTVLSSGKEKLIACKRLPWWILAIVFIYGLILVKIVFL